MAIRLMPDRECQGCVQQDEFGCFAKKWREPEPDEDPRNAWVNPAHIPITLDGEEFYACPRQTLREDPREWGHLLRYYGFYLKGFLPQPGSIIDQSNCLMEAFRVLDAVNAECDEQKRQEQNRPKGDPSNRRPGR